MFWPESSITLLGLYFNDNDDNNDNDERRAVLVHIYINSNWLTELITIHGQKQNTTINIQTYAGVRKETMEQLI